MRSLFSYLCEEYVFNDTANHDIDHLRKQLSDLEADSSVSRTRSGKIIRDERKADTVDHPAAREYSAQLDKQQTADAHYRLDNRAHGV